jgi:hypothetical protein
VNFFLASALLRFVPIPVQEQFVARTRRLIALFVAACVSFAGFMQGAGATGLISAEQVAASEGLRTAADRRARLLATLERADVAAALAERGVSVDAAKARVAALTDAETAQLAAEIDKAPAGAGELIGSVVIVLVILMFSDIFGYTHIFPFIHPAR